MRVEPNKESNNEKMMAYLYNELSEDERADFEKLLSEDKALQVELDGLKETREILKEVPKPKVSVPPFANIINRENRRDSNQAFKWVGSIAASLLILLFAAKLSGLQVSINDGQTNIAFNNNSNNDGSYIHKDDVTEMIQSSLASYDRSLEKDLNKRDAKQHQLLQTELKNNQTFLASSFKELKQDNQQMLSSYWNRSNEQQKEYMNSLMGDFTNYVELKRNEDMQYVLARINLLETDTDLLELETSQLRNTYAVNTNDNTY